MGTASAHEFPTDQLGDCVASRGAARWTGQRTAGRIVCMPVDTFERVRDLVAAHLKVDPGRITRETSLVQDLGADSLDSLELVYQIEETFDVLVPNERISEFGTVGAICEGIDSLKNAALAAPPPTEPTGSAA